MLETNQMAIEIKATVVSIVPFEVNAQKPTLHPGDFTIPKSDGKTPSIIIIGESGFDVYMGAERRPKYIHVKVSPYEAAESIVEDFVQSMIATTADARPGIFWVPGEFKLDEVIEKFLDKIQAAKEIQHRWFLELVKLADDDWTKSNHRHSAISNLQRFACESLGFKREWNEAIKTNPDLLTNIPCPACTTMINKAAMLCPNCKTILKPKEYKEKFTLANELASLGV